jgi:acetate kinase
MAASMGGLDALAFTGGVGERSAEIRAAAVAGLEFLGLAIDAARNEAGPPDADLTASGAATTTLVLRAREDVEIARQVRQALA